MRLLQLLLLSLHLADDEDASVQEPLDAVGETAFFATGKSTAGRACDAPGRDERDGDVVVGDTDLSQHMLVMLRTDSLTRACACSRSRKEASSFCREKRSTERRRRGDATDLC